MTIKKIQVYSLLALLAVLMAYPDIAAASPKVTADAAVLMDAKTGQVYYAKNPDKQRSPASLTKVMTIILALELGDANEIVTVSKRAENISVGSQINLRAEEKISLGDLTKAAALFSANDSTIAIAEHLGGNHDNFVKLMNQKALAIGAVNTRFVNTNGYSVPNHYSTAYDLALITRYALKNDAFAELVSTKEATIHWAENGRKMDVRNTNRLLRSDYPGIDGVKTGTTARAGNCLIASATRNGQQLIAVVLHSRNRYEDAAALLEYGFNEFEEQRAVEKGEVLGAVQVESGVHSDVAVEAGDDIVVDAPKDGGKVELKVYMPGSVPAPVEKGQQLGHAAVLYNGKVLKQVPLLATERVKEQGLWFKLRQGMAN
ncbi:D-alanyl-D-alanine carboxypeptidase family protein [Desulfofalx alkaliphila]|uniref:D-alanyl-D-alanine carboxypeptidase family protein n=1 Tax=Desulfofalx alkaliphila TaxID=105483 RepID=UPI000AD4B74E|nr:D-alanyl-D-alanine carboxypeptidase family protein [Desulfofalx alkaliphila]